MADLSSPSAAAMLALVLIVGVPQDANTQSGWQPAAGHTQIPLWPHGPPHPRSGVGAEAVHYAVDRDTGNKKLVGGRPYSYVANVTQPTITIYSPTKSNTGAAVIVYPGGGFNVLAMDIEGTEACEWLTSNAISCVLLKYRVPCEHEGPYRECPQAHQDAQRAMSIVRSRAGEWHIDPNKIGVMGFSAGAHMAIMSSTRFDRLYTAVDEADSVSSRPDFALVLYPGRVAYRRMNFAPNPGIRVTERTPPTFLVHAYDDQLNPVENSLLYAAALRNAGVPAEIHVYAKGGHAFGLRRTDLSTTAWPQLAEAWLKVIGVLEEQPATSHAQSNPAGRQAAQLLDRASSPVGCYSLEIGDWSSSWPAEWRPPSVVRLDSVPARLERGARPGLFMLLPTAGLPSPRSGERGFWRTLSSDSVALYWSADYVGLEMLLERRGDTLAGQVRGYTDVIRPAELESRASVQGHRVKCPARLEPSPA